MPSIKKKQEKRKNNKLKEINENFKLNLFQTSLKLKDSKDQLLVKVLYIFILLEKPTVALTPKTLIKSRLSGEMQRNKIEVERAKDRAKTNFIAQGLPETTYTPERNIAPLHKTPTEGKTPAFKSDERAVEREIFDAKLKALRERQAKVQAVLDTKREEREKEELKEYRRSLIHRPLPLPK